MKKSLLLVFSLILSMVNGQALDWSWSQAANGTTDEVCNHMSRDASGNLLITGRFSSATTTLSSVTLTNSGSTGTSEFFVAKYSPSGALQWAKRAQGLGDDEGIAVTSDPTGNIYVAGNYDSPTITFGTTTLTNNSAFTDIFVVKYDPLGNVLWAKTYGGNLLDEVRSILADNSGNTYLAGSFRSLSVSFGTVGVVNSGNSDGYLTKIDVNGNPVWAKQFGDAQNEYAYAVTHDGNGNIYVAGEFNSSALATFNLTNAGAFDIFIAKYDASGNYGSSKVIGGTLNDSPKYLTTDGTGNVYLAATYESATLPLGSFNLTVGSTRDMALIKFNSSLVAQWGKRTNGNLSSEPTSLYVDGSSLFMTGFTTLSSLSFGSVNIVNPNSGSEGFIVKYDLTGTDLWAKSTLGTGDEELQGIVTDAVGNLYVAGSYNSALALGSSTLSAIGNKDVFVSKLCAMPSPPAALTSATICPRQTGTLQVTTTSGISVNWYNVPTGGTPLLTGSNSFTATGTSTFYAEAENTTTGCTNPLRIAVSISVQPGPTVSITGKTLTASSGSTFQWLECGKDSMLPGATGQAFSISKSGHYAVIVTNNGCIDTSACIYYSVAPSGTVTVPEDSLMVNLPVNKLPEQNFNFYPNPNQGEIFIDSKESLELSICDLTGRMVLSVSVPANTTTKVFLNGLSNGIYILKGPPGYKQKRILVNR